ncbi:hypothetical protein Ddc_11251 [Ditylenchus destructor]|nr:hypothetical protein Ddc_11251 [Ditylenchus destructor]
MSCSKPLPPFVCDSLYYLNRDQLERFSIVSRPLKNFIDRYFHSKPYRFFDLLHIRGGSYCLCHNGVVWHPNRADYSAQQFLAGQKCSIDEPRRSWKDFKYYSFAEMRPFLSPTVRIRKTIMNPTGDFTYNPDHVNEMESLSYLWRDYEIAIRNDDCSRIVAEHFQPVLNSPTILQCRLLGMTNAHFPLKDYKVLYNVKVMQLIYFGGYNIDPNDCANFFEQPGNKPIVVLYGIRREDVDNLLVRLKKDLSSAIEPNAFKIVFVLNHLTEFRDTNKTSGETLELKKGLPAELLDEYQEGLENLEKYTLERSSTC